MKVNIWEVELDARILAALASLGVLCALCTTLVGPGVVRIATGMVNMLVAGYMIYCCMRVSRMRRTETHDVSKMVYPRRMMYGFLYLAVLSGVTVFMRILSWIA